MSSQESVWVVIPTYWGQAEAGIYDHPTPLNGKSTLPLLLESLIQQDDPPSFTVLLLVSAVSKEIEQETYEKVKALCVPYLNDLDLNIADVRTAEFIEQYLAQHKIDLKIMPMRGYAAVRNMQLIIPAIAGADTIIALDDDEIVPSDYLKRAVGWGGKSQDGKPIVGIAGPYLDQAGSPYMQAPDEVGNILIDKSVFMNQAMKKNMSAEPELTETSMVFGGNMVFKRELFTKVGFDPAITRGEDSDYVINSRIAGYRFYFDPRLRITHLPPRQFEAPLYAKLRQDVLRFVYEQAKVKKHGLSVGDFMPYPGKLLGEDLIQESLEALRSIASPEMVSEYGAPEEIVAQALNYTEEHAPRYELFAEEWGRAMGILLNNSIEPHLFSRIQVDTS